MSEAHQTLLEGVLGTLSSPITEQQILTLSAIVGHDQLQDALDLIDRDQVARIHLPNGRTLYQVASSNPNAPNYTVHPELPDGGYCPCPAFSRNILAEKYSQITCKHLLACRIADKLERGWNEKYVSAKWVVGWATKFGGAVPMMAKDTGGTST